MKKSRPSPVIRGNLEISKNREGVFIAGDPDGLRSLAKLLVWLADANQEAHPTMPDGEREHLHLYVYNPLTPDNRMSLTPFSVWTELCRLDAKGTGEFPERYRELGIFKAKKATGKPATKKRKVKKGRPK